LADDWVALTKQVKEASDIVAVVGDYVSLQPAGAVFKGLCPFHNDSRPSFQVDSRWQNYRCWACGKFGDVFTFVMEFEKVSFQEARDLLARRAGIPLPSDKTQNQGRARMLDVMRWAAELYHRCLLDSPLAEQARHYLGERRLTGETVRRWQLGYAPLAGDWLEKQIGDAPAAVEVLIEVGLLGRRTKGTGYYDRFRDRVMFPIRDVRGQVVGFGGRILPTSPYADRAPKYYNSCDTPLFSKSDLIYGLDQARLAGQAAGCLAVVEGYTDVLMAQQTGVGNVVATMGTALTARHVQQLRRYAPRVVLVYDADAGGSTGVDRALELFVREDVELAIATLPAGMDPCDVLVGQGPEPFRAALTEAADALDFKLTQLLERSSAQGVEGSRRAVEAVLGILALVPDDASPAVAIKRDRMLHRIAQRFGLLVETLRARLDEVRRAARDRAAAEASRGSQPPEEEAPAATGGSAKADPLERELLEVLLADAALVPAARAELPAAEVTHPGLRRLLEGLYALSEEGLSPDLDALRLRLVENPRLADAALRLQEVGRMHVDRPAWLRSVLGRFRERRAARAARVVQGQLNAVTDPEEANKLFRMLQANTVRTEV
jgi:DNA primase